MAIPLSSPTSIFSPPHRRSSIIYLGRGRAATSNAHVYWIFSSWARYFLHPASTRPLFVSRLFFPFPLLFPARCVSQIMNKTSRRPHGVSARSQRRRKSSSSLLIYPFPKRVIQPSDGVDDACLQVVFRCDVTDKIEQHSTNRITRMIKYLFNLFIRALNLHITSFVSKLSKIMLSREKYC